MPASDLCINSGRLWATLQDTAAFGATGRGGLCRLSLGADDGAVRDWFVAQAEAIGCSVRIDPIGNIFVDRPGRGTGRRAIACGSHLDTQPTGGRFDGILGVLAGLEVLRTLADAGLQTDAPLMVINWTNEEGSRFAPGLMGSSVHLGQLDLAAARAAVDADGVTVAAALEAIGYRGDASLGTPAYGSYFELHIEQGPVLDSAGDTIGVVTGAQGMRWYDIILQGAGGHAGTVPMALRRDAMMAAADLIARIGPLAAERNQPAVATVGRLEIPGASRNTIPGQVRFTLDVRHPDTETLDAIASGLQRAADATAGRTGVRIEIEQVSATPPVAFDPACIAAVRAGAQRHGYRQRDMTSGAGHDACAVAKAVPTGMIFVPCKDGVSHQEHEDMTPQDAAAGANVLLAALLDRAGVAA